MSDPVIIILGLAGIAVLAALYAWAMYASRHSARYPVRAIGIIALLAGLYITGVAELLLTGIRALVDWFRTETLDTQMWIGIGIGALGILLFLIGGVITPPTRAEAKAARTERRAAAKAERAHEKALAQSAGSSTYSGPGSSSANVTINTCQPVDEWTYNPGYGQFMTMLQFESGELKRIRYGERVTR